MPMLDRPWNRRAFVEHVYIEKPMLFTRTPLRFAILVPVLTLLVACSVDSIIPDRRPDYRKSQVVKPLELPPDLTASTIDETLVVPELNPTGTASFSDYASERPSGNRVATSETVLLEPEGMHLERDGDRYWLVVEQDPAKVWSAVKDFWISNGLLLKKEDPRLGIIETEWIENRADIPAGPIRSLLSQVIDFAYSAPTRDKFRVRLERVDDATEVYLTHYGVEESIRSDAPFGQDASNVAIWQSRPRDPELEAEMLKRLMVHLGASEKRAETEVAEAPEPAKARARLVGAGDPMMIIDENYSLAWRLVGLALDSSNFLVQDQNRAQGLYLVEYRDPLKESTEKGLLSKLAFWKDEPPPEGVRYQVRLAGRGPRTVLLVYDADGQPENSPTTRRILTSLLNAINS